MKVMRVRCGMAVQTRNLRVHRGQGQQRREVVHGIDIGVRKGSLHMLVGPNGCGKSTLLKVIGGLLPHSGGEVQVAGKTAMVFQNPDHQVFMPTVASCIGFALGRRSLQEEEALRRVEDALRRVRLEDELESPTHRLSGGQKQRLAIASALVQDADILLLDELTTFVDAEDQLGILQMVQGLTRSEQATTVIWVTHRLEELEYSDRVTLLEDGLVVLSDSPRGMLQELQRQGAKVV